MNVQHMRKGHSHVVVDFDRSHLANDLRRLAVKLLEDHLMLTRLPELN